MTGEQLGLPGVTEAPSPVAPLLDDIDGLSYLPEFLSEEEQERAVHAIDAAPWQNDLKRRVQHYGWKYDYQSRTVSQDMRIGELPGWLKTLGAKLLGRGRFDRMPDQAIINEYKPGQGIAMHVDRDCFGPVVATISLGDDWRMVLRAVDGPRSETRQLLLEAGSALVLSDAARYDWMHGISPRKREREAQGWRPRQRRLSVTFRTVRPIGSSCLAVPR